MDIQGELREAWDEVIPADEDRQSDVFAGGINDRDKVHFALGYLSAKRRFGVSKPDRRAELLELAGKAVCSPAMGRLGEMHISQVGRNAVIMAKAMLEEIDDTATKQDR